MLFAVKPSSNLLENTFGYRLIAPTIASTVCIGHIGNTPVLSRRHRTLVSIVADSSAFHIKNGDGGGCLFLANTTISEVQAK